MQNKTAQTQNPKHKTQTQNIAELPFTSNVWGKTRQSQIKNQNQMECLGKIT